MASLTGQGGLTSLIAQNEYSVNSHRFGTRAIGGAEDAAAVRPPCLGHAVAQLGKLLLLPTRHGQNGFANRAPVLQLAGRKPSLVICGSKEK